MTPEDLEQIRGVVREEIDRALEQKLFVTKSDLDLAMEVVADEFSEVRKELKTLDRRTERIDINVNSLSSSKV